MKSFFICDKCGDGELEYTLDYCCSGCNPDGSDRNITCKKCDYKDYFNFDKLIEHMKELEKENLK